MSSFTLKCLLIGHDDRIRRVGARIFLSCSECGRETHGWDLTTGTGKAAVPTVSEERSPHGLRWIFSQMLRGLRPAGLH